MHCAKLVAWVPAFAVAGLLLGCDDGGEENSCRGLDGLGRGEGALFGAKADAGGPSGEGVVALLSPVGSRGAQLCSGALIAPNAVLTARHCVEQRPAASASVVLGPSLQRPEGTLRVDQFIYDEERDLAVVVIKPEFADSRAPALPLVGSDEINVGDQATLAGFGVDEDGNVGERRFVNEPIVAVDDELLTVDGGGKSGACMGDSGGPLLLRAASGELRVAGVLSVGSASCNELDVYQRIAPVADWLNDTLDVAAAELDRYREGLEGC
jgi:hypothetical protein